VSIKYKKVKGHWYAYRRTSRRVGKRVHTHDVYLGPVDAPPVSVATPDEKSDYKEPPSTSVASDLVTDTMEIDPGWAASHSSKGETAPAGNDKTNDAVAENSSGSGDASSGDGEGSGGDSEGSGSGGGSE
jgi:hypothetical protein